MHKAQSLLQKCACSSWHRPSHAWTNQGGCDMPDALAFGVKWGPH